MNKKVAVIGGGLGGLAAAAWLARKGIKVHLFEKNESIGGRVNRIEFDGYTFDTGPMLVTLPQVVEELWSACGQNRQDYFQLQPLDPIFRYFLPNDVLFETFSDIDAFKFQISKLPEQNIRDFVDFLNYSKKIYSVFSQHLLFQPLSSQNPLKTRLFYNFLLNFHQIGAFHSVHNKVHHYFQNSILEHVFDRYSVALGASPYQVPALFNMFPWIEYGFGSYYITGGMYKLITALEMLCHYLGVNIHTASAVDRIELRNNRAAAIHVNGESMAVDAVISNAEPSYTMTQLVRKHFATTDILEKLPTSPSGLVFLWGVRGETRRLDHLNVVMSANPEQEYDKIFTLNQIVDEPTIQIGISSKTDAEHAPKGHENWYVLLKMPYQEQNWTPVIQQMRGMIFSRLKQVNIDLHGRIECERIFTPTHFKNRFNAHDGNLYGISMQSLKFLWRRQANQHSHIAGLYFAGGSAHPGSGIPLCLLSGKMAAQLALKHWQNE